MNHTGHTIEPEEVMAYVDGQLAAERAAAVAAHLNECAECQALEAEMRGISQQAQTWQVEAAPPALKHKVAVAVAESLKRKPVPRVSPSIWQLSAAAAVLLVVAAISIPNLLRSRMAANEASAVGALRTLNTACVTYASSYGGFPQSLGQLGPSDPPSKEAADLIDGILASGTKSGYRFRYIPGSVDASGKVTDYSISAEPVSVPETGVRCLYTDESGVIRSNANGPANATSAAIGGSEGLARKVQGLFGVASETPKAQANRPAGAEVATPLGPMIIRSASVTITTKEFEKGREAIEQILKRHGGYVAELSTQGSTRGSRSLTATLRIPATKLDVALAELKALGRVGSESLTGGEVTKQYKDLVSRQTNSRNTEKRLTQVLENRTGKVADVLAVEREIARVREEIEQMDAQRKTLENQVAFATVQVRIEEEYEAQVNPPQPSAWLMIRNAAVEGIRSLRETVLGLALFLLSTGPSLLFWTAVLFWPARLVWRRLRPAVLTNP